MNTCAEKEITINGIVYVPKSHAPAEIFEGMEYKIVRTYSAGVFAGYIEEVSEDGKQVTMRQAIRLHTWQGAASLSQMAMEGTNKPSGCRFAMAVDKVSVSECIELLDCTLQAQKSIEGAKSWKV